MRTQLGSPVYIPRWVLVAKYTFFIVLAGLTAIDGSRTLDLTTPASYPALWSLAVAGGALVALPASIFTKLAGAEKWAAAWIAGWLAVVAVNSYAVSSGSGWLYVVLVTLLPAGRAVALFSKRTT